MNWQIQALAEQAQILITTAGPFSSQGAYQLKGEHLAKFAELVIKETLQVARAGIEFGDGMEDAVYKYFGVEE